MEQVRFTAAAWAGLALLASLVSIRLGALVIGFSLLILLLAVKMATKVIGIWPICCLFRIPRRKTNYTTLLRSTGLTCGSISALYGINNGVIDQGQYFVLTAAVNGSAIIPTIIAQFFSHPREVHLGMDQEQTYVGSVEHFLHVPEE